ncbi:ribonuclease HII [Patescibacteria group bacterium]|nr:MAG: ribonuclease HII [Patescibacteria group bacterium]
MKALPTNQLELEIQTQGYNLVAGIDEVGRGPAAGPVTIAAVILQPDAKFEGLQDSKLVSPKRRLDLDRQIRQQAIAIGIGWASSRYIDEKGVTAALRFAGSQAINQLSVSPNALILDGVHNYLMLPCHTVTMAKADQTSTCVAAASIIAKVARDRYMELLHESYPQYGFAGHKGYLAASHMEALRQYGPSPHHRYSWAPVREVARAFDH